MKLTVVGIGPGVPGVRLQVPGAVSLETLLLQATDELDEGEVLGSVGGLVVLRQHRQDLVLLDVVARRQVSPEHRVERLAR